MANNRWIVRVWLALATLSSIVGVVSHFVRAEWMQSRGVAMLDAVIGGIVLVAATVYVVWQMVHLALHRPRRIKQEMRRWGESALSVVLSGMLLGWFDGAFGYRFMYGDVVWILLITVGYKIVGTTIKYRLRHRLPSRRGAHGSKQASVKAL